MSALFGREVRRGFFDMTRCKEFYFSVLAAVILIFVPLIFALTTFYKKDQIYIEPAYVYWGPAGTNYYWNADYAPTMFLNATINEIFVMILLPFFASMSYAYRMFDDRKSGSLQIVAPRAGYKTYCLGVLTVTFLGAFLTVFVPLGLEQIVLLIACPINTPFMNSSLPYVDDYVEYFGNQVGGFLSALLLNFPYGYNFLFCLLPAVLAGMFSVFSATLSLYITKSRFLVLTLVGIVWIVLFFVTGVLYYKMNVGLAALPNGNFALYPIIICILAVASAALQAVALSCRKDVGL